MKSNKTLPITTGILALIHLVIIVNAFYQGSLSFSNFNDILFIVLLLIFLTGFAISWKRKKIAGVIIMTWNVCIWILDLYIIGDKSDTDSGLISLFFSPVLVLGAFFLLEWYKTSKATMPSKQQQWKFILRVLLINYAVLYSILVFAELSGTTGKIPVDYSSLPFVLHTPLLLIFIAGFVLSWKRELLTGIVFLVWCAIAIYDFFGFPGTYFSGPWGLCILPILLQGIFYINNHYVFKQK